MTDFRNRPVAAYLKKEGVLPELDAGQYPPNARTPNERWRFRACVRMAREMFPPVEGEPRDEALIWQTSRSLFNNPEVTVT